MQAAGPVSPSVGARSSPVDAGGGALALLALFACWQAFGAGYENAFTLPGAETQKAQDLLQARFPQLAGDRARIVFPATRVSPIPPPSSAFRPCCSRPPH